MYRFELEMHLINNFEIQLETFDVYLVLIYLLPAILIFIEINVASINILTRYAKLMFTLH